MGHTHIPTMKAFLLFLISNGVLSANLRCGYQPRWRLYEEPKDDDYGHYGVQGQLAPSNDKRLTFIEPKDSTGYNTLNMTSSLNLRTGIFTAPVKANWIDKSAADDVAAASSPTGAAADASAHVPSTASDAEFPHLEDLLKGFASFSPENAASS